MHGAFRLYVYIHKYTYKGGKERCKRDLRCLWVVKGILLGINRNLPTK